MAKDLSLYKFLALGALGLYAFKKFQSNPKSLGHSPQEVSQKANKIIDNLIHDINIPPQYRHPLNNIAKKVAETYIENKMPAHEMKQGFQYARDVTGSV